jgi:hypothetical protein
MMGTNTKIRNNYIYTELHFGCGTSGVNAFTPLRSILHHMAQSSLFVVECSVSTQVLWHGLLMIEVTTPY